MDRTTKSSGQRRQSARTRRADRTARMSRQQRRSAARPRIATPLTPASAHAAFTAAFTEYWRAIQAQQAAVMTRAQEAYATFIKELQNVWNEEPVRAQIAERCLAFAERVREAPAGAEGLPVMESAYRDYVEQLRDAWMQSDLQQRIEDQYLQVTETIQRANEQSQQKLDVARHAYVEKLCAIWTAVAPAQLDADTLGRVSRNMMVTVFFTEGMRPPEASLPEPAMFT